MDLRANRPGAGTAVKYDTFLIEGQTLKGLKGIALEGKAILYAILSTDKKNKNHTFDH